MRSCRGFLAPERDNRSTEDKDMKQIAAIFLFLGTWAMAGDGPIFYEDDPLIQEPQPRPLQNVASRKLSDYYDILSHTLATPGEKQVRGKPAPAQSVNTLGDPMEGAWWERRHYWRRMTLAELEYGTGNDTGPAMDGEWTVISAKTEGITPGFVILDRYNRKYYVKFDPLSNPEMATGAEQIASRIFYALGYHVPENRIVYFRPEMLKLGEEVKVEDKLGRKHKMTQRDLSEILLRVHRGNDGRYRATASLAIPGKSIGPYRYFGTRTDDPNDTVPHERRRDLRGMRLACAFVDHDDSRSINTLDALADGASGKFVKHYQQDFGSTLGSGSTRINSPRSGGEYLFDWRQAGLQLVSLGLAIPSWARAKYPKLKSVGLFESEVFDPDKWVPEYPNPAFLNSLPDDDFWMAKQIVNLKDEEIRAIVKSAQYSDPRAAEWVTKCLIERRDKIGRSAFAKVLPVDRFELRNGRLEWTDLAAESGLGKALEITIHWAAFDNKSGTSQPIAGENSPHLPQLNGDGYRLALLQSASRPSQAVRVYVRIRGNETQIVGVERTW
jgi:hypothetical protein